MFVLRERLKPASELKSVQCGNTFQIRSSLYAKKLQEAQLMLTTGSTRLAVSRGQQLWRSFSEIFNVEKCRGLEIGVRGHSRSLKVVPFGRSCMVSY